MMLNPELDNLVKKTDSKYTLVIEVAKRARQINDFFRNWKAKEIIRVRPPQIKTNSQKPITIALEEIAQGKLSFRRTVDGIK
jgi:DNA-directed RNA polymerase subunit omega